MGRILVVDDHDSLRKGLVRALANAGHDVEEAANGTVAIERLQDSQFDVVLTDLRMGGADGMDVLRTTRSIQPTAAVILMTAFGSIHTAVEAMKIGAFDFVQKPFEIEEMELKIEKAIELRHLKYQVEYLRDEQQDIYNFERIVGASGALQHVLSIVKKVARSNSTILIRGETGTGKELIAGAIHHNSNRANRAFVKVNCAALQENLLESELFGHEKGAFTSADKQRIGRFETADGGTLFLDEVGDMSPSTQAKILRVLQEHEFERLGGTRTLRVDVRVIAATNRHLTQMVQEGRFREDLFYRLNVVSVEMPPLRDRKDDIGPLAEFFAQRFASELKKKVDGVHPEAMKVLMRHNWPGNIRELENLVRRYAILGTEEAITSELLPRRQETFDEDMPIDGPISLKKVTRQAVLDLERKIILKVLQANHWNRKRAARALSISYRALLYKIRDVGLPAVRGRGRPEVSATPPEGSATPPEV
jgi:DNA-binding NtrC family response regulator